jgi:hypothetical protein
VLKHGLGHCLKLLGTVGLVERLQNEGTVDERQLYFIPNCDTQLVQYVFGQK